MKLNRANVETKLREYLESVDSVELVAPHKDVLTFMHYVKRQPLGSGPYPEVSFFEASNRVFSDIIILFGVRRLLANPLVGDVRLPFDEYEVALGVQAGHDLKATAGSCRLVGEAFNVAQSYFQEKKRRTIKKLRREQEADYRLIIFNADAVKKPTYYVEISQPSMLYLPIDMWAERCRALRIQDFS